MSDKMTCLGECRKEHSELCYGSGKCAKCCDNECGCGFASDPAWTIDASRYDNLCESKWLKSQPEAQ